MSGAKSNASVCFDLLYVLQEYLKLCINTNYQRLFMSSYKNIILTLTANTSGCGRKLWKKTKYFLYFFIKHNTLLCRVNEDGGDTNSEHEEALSSPDPIRKTSHSSQNQSNNAVLPSAGVSMNGNSNKVQVNELMSNGSAPCEF